MREPCSVCKGTHKVYMVALNKFVKCPQCTSLTSLVEILKEEGTSIDDILFIPSQYRDEDDEIVPVDEEIITKQSSGLASDASVVALVKVLKSINEAIYNQSVLRASLYFSTPNVIDLRPFVYGAQKLALENGLGVVPMISCNLLYGLQRVSDFDFKTIREASNSPSLVDVSPELVASIEGYRLTQATNLSYFDFIYADLCFIEVTANTAYKGWNALADLLGERSRNGLPTYVLGYWGSTNYRGSQDLRYLLTERVGKRLDLLYPVEVSTKNKQSYSEVPNYRVRSKINAGYTVSGLFEG